MRIKSEVWVKAYIRSSQSAGAFVVLLRRGDADAGAIYIKVCDRDLRTRLFGPAPAGFSLEDRESALSLRFVPHFDGESRSEEEVDQQLMQFHNFDPDLWIIEVQDADGRHFLDGWLE